MIKERIEALRALMRQWGWDAAITVGEDPHNSEYTPLRWCQRQFISGFTGSAGVVIVTADHAGLWTDSRYFIQAERELKGSGIELHKMESVECTDWIPWIAANVPDRGKVGVDGLCMSMGQADALQELFAARKVKLVSKPDYLSEIWPDRPSLPQGKVWIYDEKYTGLSTAAKLDWLRGKLAMKDCGYALVTCLDQIGWLLNIRSTDVDYCPFVISFCIVGPDRADLFLDENKLTPEVSAKLAADSIFTHPYLDVTKMLAKLEPEAGIMIDPASLNFDLGAAVRKSFSPRNIVFAQSPIDLAKSVKNSVEIEGFRRAYIADGVAQTRFYHWLEDSLKAGKKITEADAADCQHELRAMCPDFLDESFETISAYQENSALPHYSTVRGQDAVIGNHGLYLNDSGGHYYGGTTDITRTIPVGPLTQLEREDYTIDLKAMIDLSMAVFPAGTPGCRLDAVCRRALWQTRRNFGHGTGHGVGNLLSVHEGPQTIRQNLKDQPMMPGMITSNEPGIYREGYHGIRHENMILCVDAGQNEFGSWLAFETLTMTYIDTAPVIRELLDADEIAWLNAFNAKVCATLTPLLDEADALWLRTKTQPI